MTNYLILQFKRVFKLFPLFLLISTIFFASLTTVYLAFINMNKEEDYNTKIKIAIAGEPDDKYVDMGLAAIKSMDSSRFALELVRLSEEEAEKQLQEGLISAYAVFPEGFVDNALSGQIDSIRFVTTSSSTNLVSMFKDEITIVITEIMTQSQSASYGAYDALMESGNKKLANKVLNKISVEYVGLILDRSNVYDVKKLDVEPGIQLPEYLFCSFTVLYVCVMILPFAHLYIKKDNSINGLLHSHGILPAKQIFSEYIAFFTIILLVFLIIMAFLSGTITVLENANIKNIEFSIPLAQIAKYIFPIILVVSSFGFMIYELSGNIISGILTYFFTIVFLCYTSGCIYPIYMLPKTLQILAQILPFGIARSFLTNGSNRVFSFTELLTLMLYSGVFITVSVFIRRYKIITRSNK